MQMLSLIAILALVFVLGAISHERDIYRNLKKYGRARSAAWTCEIYSPQMKIKKIN